MGLITGLTTGLFAGYLIGWLLHRLWSQRPVSRGSAPLPGSPLVLRRPKERKAPKALDDAAAYRAELAAQERAQREVR
jgi:hypothetical protein